MDPARSQDSAAPLRPRLQLSKESMAFVARLDAAEAAVRREDYRTAVQLLHRTPSLLQGSGDGRVYELMALCATHTPLANAGDPWTLWNRCLVAYQEVHDGRGMERAHRNVGLCAYGRGELNLAAQHLRRAQALVERQGRPDACIEGLCAQAEVAMAQGSGGVDQAYAWANEAVTKSQAHEGFGLLESQARLARARASCLMGAVAEAAFDMLWAERVAPGAIGKGVRGLQLGLSRAESLLLLGYPHRAVTCLAACDAAAQATHQADVRAQYNLLLCEALLGDQPHDAHAAGLAAWQFFNVRKLSYFRAASEISLVRTALRLGHDDCAARLRALTGHRLERWPLLAFALKRAQYEVESPHHQPLGAVKTPWMRAVGKIEVPPVNGQPQQAASEQTTPGFMGKLSHVIGRVMGEEHEHAATTSKQG